MTREEIKKVLPVIQAFTEGKVIQTKNGDETWITIGKETDLNIELLAEYPDCFRIKPEPEYRPFKDADECWQEMLKHEPFGWVRNKFNHNGVIATIICLDSRKEFRIHTNFNHGNTSEDMINSFIFADGAPFGILEEE